MAAAAEGRGLMPGYRSSRFRWNCGTSGCYVSGLPSWDDILACFPRKIAPTDIDGMCEVNRHFLFLDQKNPGAVMKAGQRMAYLRLSELPRVTVCVVRAVAGREDAMEVLRFEHGRPVGGGWQMWGRGELLDWLRAWSAAAEATVLPGDVGAALAVS